MKSISLYASMLLFMVAMSSCGNNADKNTDSKKEAMQENKQMDSTNKQTDDSKFAVNAADGGMLEVQLGKLAQTNASSAEVKQFGQEMVKDHSKGNDELKALAQQKNIALPASLSNDKMDKVNDLSKKQGADFDKAYVDFMVKDHKEDIDEYQKEADKGGDADVKAWAGKTVPILQHHLQMAQMAQDNLNKKK